MCWSFLAVRHFSAMQEESRPRLVQLVGRLGRIPSRAVFDLALQVCDFFFERAHAIACEEGRFPRFDQSAQGVIRRICEEARVSHADGGLEQFPGFGDGREGGGELGDHAAHSTENPAPGQARP